ncbi:MAG: OsmC family protein [Candidatus Parabeggiatoa sp. nov. 3]|jgi:putative redox protein|nr:MAG: OsmC family protein [Gammaproteobacteria bacterium]RKZ57299.1 MAG: OsmC family protein [Gammaproteobacteria bacterium]RKZ76137.1 MAG: OsmC family protein [Gammaproteobacteria bacterium]
MKARIKWVENACLMAEAESGHGIVIDGAGEIGGRNLGVRPMEMILMGLGGCTAMDVLSILKKQRQNITDCVIEVSGQRREQPPKIFTDIHIHYIITGRDLKNTKVKRAVDLSAESYCSVSAMLGKSANITHDYEIVELA